MSRRHPYALVPGPASDPGGPAAGKPPSANRQPAGVPESWEGAVQSKMSNHLPASDGARSVSLRRLVPLLVLIGGLVLFFALGLGEYLSFEALNERRDWLTSQVERFGLAANLAFVLIYAAATAFSLPFGWVLTVIGGFVFGTLAATLCVILGATVGAVCLFLAARYAFHDLLHAKAGPALLKMERGFKENAFSYLLVLRLVPLFPFWLVNLVPALLGVPLRIYVIATVIGIVPGTFVYASVGNGLGEILAAGGSPDASLIYDADVLIPLLGLALLALLPVAYKAWKGRRDETRS